MLMMAVGDHVCSKLNLCVYEKGVKRNVYMKAERQVLKWTKEE